jgi:hypothetical protein
MSWVGLLTDYACNFPVYKSQSLSFSCLNWQNITFDALNIQNELTVDSWNDAVSSLLSGMKAVSQ